MRLTPTAIKKLKKPGYHNDGRGLYLRVTKAGTKSWIFRWRDRTTTKLRDMGLGSAIDFTLEEVREAASAARKRLHAGLDPIIERDKDRAAQRFASLNILTFDECAERYITAHQAGWKNQKHIQQWHNTLETYVSPVFGELPVNLVNDDHVLAVLEAIWHTKTETASRVRSRIERVLDWATARKYYEGLNPARWRGHLDTMLPSPGKIKNERHHSSLPHAELSAFLEGLSKKSGIAARCLEFTILTACRTGETIGAEWSEVDTDAALWTIPASRMKANREHRVPLSGAILNLLKGLPRLDSEYLFPGMRGGHLSNMAMLKLLRDLGYQDITVHGFRSTFRNWAAEQTAFAREVCEASLAHTLKDKTEAAYLHSDLLDKRALLMETWSAYCLRPPHSIVVQIKAV